MDKPPIKRISCESPMEACYGLCL